MQEYKIINWSTLIVFPLSLFANQRNKKAYNFYVSS